MFMATATTMTLIEMMLMLMAMLMLMLMMIMIMMALQPSTCFLSVQLQVGPTGHMKERPDSLGGVGEQQVEGSCEFVRATCGLQRFVLASV